MTLFVGSVVVRVLMAVMVMMATFVIVRMTANLNVVATKSASAFLAHSI
jgi:hypothetical protein